MNALFTRLSLALLAIMLGVGGALYALERWSSAAYHEEVTQRLNASIAMYVTGQTQLIRDGVINRDEFRLLAERAMVINPSAEVYLLDTRGRILAHALPPGSVRSLSVGLAPIRALVSGEREPPVYADDPMNPGRRKVFSAAPVMDGGSLQGYLYVVLGGRQYDALADSVHASYARKSTLVAMGSLLAAAVLAGLCVFAFLTRRLTRLARVVESFSASALQSPPDSQASREIRELASGGAGDEIDTLSRTFAVMAERIVEQFERLQDNERLRRELIGNVSHDLRTPLAALQGYVDTLRLKGNDLDEEERRQYLEITLKHARRLSSLVDDLFELSKLDSGSMPITRENFSLTELLHDVVQEFELEARRQGVQLKFAGQPRQALVCADIGLVQRVLENLIRNALEHTPPGGSVVLDLESQAEEIAISVSDTGCGISENELENIFERYFTASSARSDQGDSSGLGLAIVKGILDLHGSRINVSSGVGKGTRFDFSLPTASAT